MKVKFAFVFVLLAAAFLPAAVYAAPAMQEAEPALPSLADFVESAKNLGGIALLFAALLNAGKQYMPGLFPDGSAKKYNLVVQTFVVTGLVALQLAGRADLVPIIDENAGILATVITGALALAYNLWVSRKWHQDVLAGFPVIGTSYSGRGS